MAERKVVPFDEFYYQLKLMHFILLHPVYIPFHAGKLKNCIFIHDHHVDFCFPLTKEDIGTLSRIVLEI
jgi:hypothetical protein